ncbi:hypothetical protein CEXT_573821 [Caerostris extrusa]|uniref:Uncharacterized protein n=1 Tax=Caerostris extrusa TaxID=172846 RepID=A0AAV4SFF8_CAEEX|nr:hypothetical protein CEXT_573821 [Caerostris extrusa]
MAVYDLSSEEIKTVWIAPPAWKYITGPFMLYVCLHCHFISKNENSLRAHDAHRPNMYRAYFIMSYSQMQICPRSSPPRRPTRPRLRTRLRRPRVGTRRQPDRACKYGSGYFNK